MIIYVLNNAKQEAGKMKITVRDIARAAGVSPATVSNAFSGNNRIGEETRLRVLEIARQMGYREANQIQLNRGIHFVIFRRHGRVVIDSPFFSELISGIESACRKLKYELTISYAYPDDRELIDSLLRETARPLLLLATEMTTADIRPCLKVKAPLVVLDSQFMDISFSTVHIDNVKAGYIAGSHFADRGHTRFGMITSSIPFNNVRDRRLGYEMALRERGYAMDEEDVFALDPTVEGAYEDMFRIMDMRDKPLPTAIFAFNDLVAAGAIRAMKQHGIKVPDDVSVIGMDNLPTVSMLNPALTSVNVPKYEMGRAAVEQLIRMADGGERHIVKTAIDVQLVERDSVLGDKTKRV